MAEKANTHKAQAAAIATMMARGATIAPGAPAREASLFATLKRTATEFSEDNLTDWAAALTYYGLLSLFPALIALVSIVGLFADPESTTQTITDIVTQIGPESAALRRSPARSSPNHLESRRGGDFVRGRPSHRAVVGVRIRGCVHARLKHHLRDPRGTPHLEAPPTPDAGGPGHGDPAGALLALALVLTGPVAEAVAEPLGISDAAVTAWDIAKWPVMLAVVVRMISVLYYASPNVKLRGFKWVTPGSIVAVVVWLIASAAFAFYVANFGSYDKTYGALGGVVVTLIWLWITNLALLFGHQLNAERERSHSSRKESPGPRRRSS